MDPGIINLQIPRLLQRSGNINFFISQWKGLRMQEVNCVV